MTNNYPISGKLITKAIRAISVNTGVSVKALEHMYATQLGYSLATIKGWKTGKSRPATRDAIWIIARDGIEKGQLHKEWLLTFADELNLPSGLKSELLRDLLDNRKDVKDNSKIIIRKMSIFLCHSSLDKPIVKDLFAKLQNAGFDPWLDEEKLLAGQDWDLEIRRAVKNSDAVIICLSNLSVTREGYIQKEIKIALDIADEKPQDVIFLIPLRLEDCEAPMRLKKWQWVDLYKKDGYDKLITSLKKRAQQLGRTVKNTTQQIHEINIENPKQRLSVLEFINAHFNVIDLQELCFRSFIDYDHLPGKTKIEKSMELVLYCERVNRLNDLEKNLKTLINERK